MHDTIITCVNVCISLLETVTDALLASKLSKIRMKKYTEHNKHTDEKLILRLSDLLNPRNIRK